VPVPLAQVKESRDDMLKRNAAAKPEDTKSANSLQLTDSINAEEEAHLPTEEQQNYRDDLEARYQVLLENQAELEYSRNHYAMLMTLPRWAVRKWV